MKKKILALLIAFIISSLGFVHAESDTIDIFEPTNQPQNFNNINENMRGVWVASVLNINYPTVSTSNSALLKIEADNIIESAKNAGFNAIFLQVRPTADSLYKSKIFPWSKYLTGKEGLAPANDFDPLQYFIEQAHKKGMAVHAWVNPYRITKRLDKEEAYTVNKLSKNHPARLHTEYVISQNGDLYFDPALPEVRDLITAGIKEIIDNYDVDGVHFDDYFYPSTDFNDEASYKKYAKGKNKEDWRRENVNKLVEQVYNTVHSANKTNPDGTKKNLVFGISPFGIWANNDKIPSGSKTKGNESYFSHYADSKYWINHGIIDYIAPQIYWHIGFKIADFKVLTDWWDKQVSNSKVKLYVGLAAYRSDKGKRDTPWFRNYELRKQLQYLKNKKNVDGFIAFSIGSIRDSNRVYNAFRGYGKIKSREAYTFPSINLYGGGKKQYVGGLLHPTNPGSLNGEKLINVSDKGFFGILMEANDKKSYTLKNNGKTVSKVYQPYKGNWKPKSKPKKKNYEYLNDKIKDGAVIYAKIKEDETNLRVDNDPKEGSAELLVQGVMDEIESVKENMLKLSSGRYIEAEKVDFIYANFKNRAVFSNAEYIKGNDVDRIVLTATEKPFMRAYIKDKALVLTISNKIGLPKFNLPKNAMITSYKIETIDKRNAYVLRLEDINRLGGYYVEYLDNKIIFNIKHKKTIKDNNKPLEGFNIVLDAGHGGGDTGALGLLGTNYAEKDVTLDMTLKLNKKLNTLGANVILTRDKDEFISLHDRLKFVYHHKPDLFISIHANSCGLQTDVNKIKGFSVYYSKDIAADYAKLAQYHLCMNTACTHNKARMNDFYVIRGTHCPSVLLETGFMPNPEDFDWLCDDKKQDEFVSELTRTILLYFEK